MRPVRLPSASKGIVRLPGLFRAGRGFVRQAGQLFVELRLSPEILSARLAEGLAARPSLYLDGRA